MNSNHGASMADLPVDSLGDLQPAHGYSDDRGLEKCPACGVFYSANGLYHDTVYDTDGTEYDSPLDTDPADGPFFCAECWVGIEADVQASQHRTLDSFGAE